jgi:rhodanese-related sulfurtransferase/uncharacterized membrane protein YedE/YeeE
MTAPLFDPAHALAAVPIGLAFGAALERAGLGRTSTVAGQLAGTDFTVIKVMFSAIITAMLLLFWSDRLGMLDLSRVAVPSTDVGPQFLGALLFGAGFALSSLCPGSACVAAATGARDGVLTIAGLGVGTLVTAELWSRLGRLAERAPREGALLPDDLGLSTGVVIAVIAIAGVGVLHFGDRWDGRPATPRPALHGAVAALALLAAIAGPRPLSSISELQVVATEIVSEHDHVDPIVLAEWIMARKPGLRVIDVRETIDSTDGIPQAELLPLSKVSGLTTRPGETVVLYSDGGTHAAQAWVLLRARGVRNAFVLRDGLAAWEDEVLSPTIPADASDTAAVARFSRARVVSRYFGGMPRTDDRPSDQSRRIGGIEAPQGVRPRRRNTC